MIETRPIDSIKVGDRIRKDLGDLDALAASITENGGLLQPVLIKSDGTLIAGERRLAACKKLGRDLIEVNVRNDFGSATAVLIAERDENTCRKDFTPSEAVALGKRLEELERPKAQERERAGVKQPCAESAQGSGKTRDKVSAAVGMGHTRYTEAKAVVAAAEGGDPVALAAKEEMDATGRVSGAYRKVTRTDEPVVETQTDSSGREQPKTFFGKGDKWQEATEPLVRYLRGQRKRNFDFSHLNWKEAKKRVQRIDDLITDLEAARADLEPRSYKAKLSF